MLNKSFCFCLCTLLFFGCATVPPPVLNLPQKANVGIINLIDREATHTHIGTTAFNNFEKNYFVNWGYHEKTEKELIAEIQKFPQFDVLSIEAPERIVKNESEILNTAWNLKLNDDLVPDIAEIMKQHKIDVLLIIRDGSGEDYMCATGRYLKNYGIYTRTFLGIKTTHAYVYSNIVGFYGNPPQYIGGAWLNEHYRLENFSYPSDIKEMDIAKLNEYGPLITDNIPDFIKKAVIGVGLNPSEKR